MPLTPAHRSEAFHSLSGSAPRQPPTAPPAVWSAAPANVQAPKPATKPFNLEWIIGTKGLAAAGALAVVIGVIFFLKYAVEQGWISHIPPLVRCLCGVAFGGALVAVGEVARRKVNGLAAAGIYAAGIACAYASVYAGYGYFNPPVIPQTVAFVALALISAMGIALSASTRLVSVAIVSLVGAYLAPFLLRSDNPNPLVFPVYAGALLATGLILAAWLRGAFRWVGRSVWWSTMVLGGMWGAFNIHDHPLIVIGFALAVWAMIHAAHIIAARGQFVTDDQRDEPTPKATFDGSGPMLSSFSVTGWATILMTLALRSINPSLDWLAPCGMTAATGAMAVWLAGHLGVVRNRPRTDAERLGASLALQAASALIGTVALATSSSGPAAALLWLCMGVGAIAAGRWGRALAASIYGNVLLVIGLGRLILWDSWHANLFSPTVDALGVALSPWTAWMTLAAAAWIGAGWIISIGTPTERKSIWGSILACWGVAVLCAGFLHTGSNKVALTWVYIALSVAVLGLHRLRRQLSLHLASFALITMVTLKVAAVDALSGRIPADSPRLLGLPLTPSMGLCIGLAVAWGLLALAARSRIGTDPRALARATGFSIVSIVMLMLAPITQDVDTTHLIWPWAAVAVLAALAARAEPRMLFRPAGMVVAVLASVAWVMAYIFYPGFKSWSIEPFPLTHPGLLSALAVVTACLIVGRFSGREAPDSKTIDVTPTVCFVTGAFMLWLSTSFEASRVAEIVTGSDQARGAAVSIWWGLLAVSILLVGFRRAVPGLRYAGLSLLGLAGVKVVLFDMAGAPQLARVAGFVTLGLLMLGTAVGYARVAKTLEAAKPKPEAENTQSVPPAA